MRAYDGMNNIFNLAYEVLGWKIHKALVKAKLSLIWDFYTVTRWV